MMTTQPRLTTARMALQTMQMQLEISNNTQKFVSIYPADTKSPDIPTGSPKQHGWQAGSITAQTHKKHAYIRTALKRARE